MSVLLTVQSYSIRTVETEILQHKKLNSVSYLVKTCRLVTSLRRIVIHLVSHGRIHLSPSRLTKSLSTTVTEEEPPVESSGSPGTLTHGTVTEEVTVPFWPDLTVQEVL